MRSRTSLFDKTVLKKNITRFAPAWGLYTLGLLMALLVMAEPDRQAAFAGSISDTMAPMAVVNFVYALVCALLLWGDLYNTRMCNALHALPLRRETWFCTHVLSGVLFSLVPNLVMTLIALVFLPRAWEIPLLWLGCVTMQYLFFFGLAVLCACLVGSRFAMAVVYGILNFLAMIAYWLADSLYVPLLYGVVTNEEAFFLLTPVCWMSQSGWLHVDSYGEDLGYMADLPVYWEFRASWGYGAVCAVLGVALLALALNRYKKRDLEKAGDFMTVTGLEPVFLVVYTLCAGALCHAIGDIFFLSDERYIFLALGVFIGFFTGRMLLQRTVRVFRWKTLGGFALFVAAFALSLVMTRWDPVGISRWIPAPQQVKNVSINAGGAYYYREDGSIWADIDQIEEIQTIHRYAIENSDQRHRDDNAPMLPVNLIYEMKSGRTVIRQYTILRDSEAGDILKRYISSPEYVLGPIWTEAEEVLRIHFPDPGMDLEDPTAIRSLLEAIVADCKAGNMPQSWQYMGDGMVCWLDLETITTNGARRYRSIQFNEDASNTFAWMEARGIDPEKWK